MPAPPAIHGPWDGPWRPGKDGRSHQIVHRQAPRGKNEWRREGRVGAGYGVLGNYTTWNTMPQICHVIIIAGRGCFVHYCMYTTLGTAYLSTFSGPGTAYVCMYNTYIHNYTTLHAILNRRSKYPASILGVPIRRDRLTL